MLTKGVIKIKQYFVFIYNKKKKIEKYILFREYIYLLKIQQNK